MSLKNQNHLFYKTKPQLLNKSYRRLIKGISLIEVMVTLLILSAGLLGIALMMWSSQTGINQTYFNQQAYMDTSSILEQMRGNVAAVPNHDYDLVKGSQLDKTALGSCQSSACQPKALAVMEKNSWLENIQNTLPGGDASITSQSVGGNTEVSIVIYWIGRQVDNTNAPSSKNIQIKNQEQSFTVTTLF